MKKLHVFYIFIFLSSLARASQEAPQTFTFDGRAFSDTAATTPLLDNITLRIQILNQAQDCILYEEQQSVSTTLTSGYFTIQVGSVVGAGKRTALDSTHMMSDVYSNTLASISGKLVSNGAACTYNPANSHVRYVRLLMTPSDMVTRTISPNMALDSVPYASVAERAETLEGLYPANLIQVNTTAPANLTQANIESIFSTTNFPRLTSLLSVAPSNYVQTGANGSALLPVVAGNPGSGLTSGQIWYDSTANVLKYYDGAVKTVGTSGASTGPIVDNTNSATTAIAVTQSGSGYAGTFMGGNVGIGTTTPSSRLVVGRNDTADEVLIGDDNWLGGPYNDSSVRVNIGSTSSNSVVKIGQGGSDFGQLAWIYSATAANRYFSISSINSGATAAVSLQPTGGNVGIGTVAPTNLLSLGGGAAQTFWMERNTAGAGNGLTIQAGGAASGANNAAGGNLVLSAGTATGNGNFLGSSITFKVANSNGTGGTSDVAPTAVMGISEGSGNPSVWIGGNTNQSAPLFLQMNSGTSYVASPGTSGNISAMSAPGSTYNNIAWGDGTFAFSELSVTNSSGNKQAAYMAAVSTTGATSYTPALVFGSSNNGTHSERMRIDQNGNVGIGTAAPAEKLEVVGALKLGTTAATNAGTIRWDGINFQGYNGSVWRNFVPNPPASGACDTSNVYSASGIYGYTVPASFGTITIQVWGGGGGGGGAYATGYAANGGTSSVSSLGLVANGGGGGQNSNGSLGTGGSGGTASGGSTNSAGTSGGAATASNVSGAGGTAPNGGVGGASSGSNGIAGGSPGGGASGAGIFGNGAGGGGSGGYTTKTFTPATLIPGTYINDISVGASGAANASSGANGGAGQVTISCSTTGTPTLNDRSLVFVSGSTYSTNANLIYDATGKLGIGTASPQTTLDVNGVIRVAKYAAQPFACDAAHDSSLAITSGYRQCVCKGGTATWVFTSDGTTSCTW